MIKILRDICINQPDFPKTTEICVKMIRRISDEEGIKVTTLVKFRVHKCSNNTHQGTITLA